MFNLVIFGPPGAGKGTQATIIAKKYNLAHISTGDLFRYEIRNQTELGVKVKKIVDSGELVPDELLIDLLKSGMAKFEEVNGIIFDGFPRTIRQAEDLDVLLAESDDAVTLTLALDVDQDELIKRILHRSLKQNRVDDTEEVIQNRLKVYAAQTSPLINYYKDQKKFESVRGMGSIEEIIDKLCKVIDKYI